MRPPTGNIITQASHGTSKAVDYSWYRFTNDDGVYAPEDGVIDSYQQRGTGKSDAGNCLRLKGAHGLHQFAHLSKSLVNVGQRVVKGQKLAIMGATGYTEPAGAKHLHYWVQTPSGYKYPPELYTEPFGSIIPSKGNEDMIVVGDEAILRIINSEVKGWDISQVHRGEFDAREINAWKGKDFRQFISEAWAEGQWYRDLKGRQAGLQVVVDKLNRELGERPTKDQLNEALAKIQKETDKALKAEEERVKAMKLAEENSKKYEEEKSKKSEDTKLLDRLSEVVKGLIERLKR